MWCNRPDLVSSVNIDTVLSLFQFSRFKLSCVKNIFFSDDTVDENGSQSC